MLLETTIEVDLLAVAPRLSVTVAVIVNVPAVLYVCDALGPLTAALPSPKLMLLETILPSGSVDPAVEAVIVTGAVIVAVEVMLVDPEVTLNVAVGG
jgi:hypothetical protein